MSFEAESNSELTVIVPAHQLHFPFPLQNKIHKQKILSDTRTGILGSIAGPCDFLPARSDGPTNFKMSDYLVNYHKNGFSFMLKCGMAVSITMMVEL